MKQELRNGYNTSEALFTGLFATVIGGYGVDSADPMVKAAAIIAIGFVVGMYAISRGWVKERAS